MNTHSFNEGNDMTLLIQSFPGTDWSEDLVHKFQPDGKLLVGGTADYGTFTPPGFSAPSDFRWVLTRYNSDLSVDAFTQLMSIGTGHDNELTDITLQTDGKILLSGFTWQVSPGVKNLIVVRLNPDFTLDASFGTTGIVTIHEDNIYFEQVKVIVDPATGNVCIGTSTNVGHWQWLWRALSPTGALLYRNKAQYVGADARMWGLALQTDGKILGCGDARDASNNLGFFVCRQSSQLVADTSFGGQGADNNGVFTLFSEGSAIAFSILQLTDGTVLVGGSAGNRCALALYSAAGVLVWKTTFGLGLLGNDEISVIRLTPSGKILCACQTQTTGSNWYLPTVKWVLAQRNMDGTPDTSFGTNGVLEVDNGTPNESVYALSLNADGSQTAFGGHVLVNGQGVGAFAVMGSSPPPPPPPPPVTTIAVQSVDAGSVLNVTGSDGKKYKLTW